MKTVIIGIGNPGASYEATRHNFGYLFIDSLAEAAGVTLQKHKTGCLVNTAGYAERNLIIAKTGTMMNNSGSSVAALTSFYAIDPDHVVIVYDDIDLDLGNIRVGTYSSSGGHNGIKSIIEHLGTKKFLRLRLGIGPQKGSSESYVLAPWSAAQRSQLPDVLEKAQSVLWKALDEGPGAAQAAYHSKQKSP